MPIAARATLPILLSFGLLLAGCTTQKETTPPRSATETLLISSAADRAAEELAGQIPVRSKKVFVDTTYFDQPDGKYAIGAIRGALSKQGAILADKAQADMVVEIRAGTLSIDQTAMLVGLPSIPIPLPLAGVVNTPELSLYKKSTDKAVAKFAATVYQASDGTPIVVAGPNSDSSFRSQYVLFFMFAWEHDDIIPSYKKD